MLITCVLVSSKDYFLRRLRVVGVDQKVMFLFYQAVLESILKYGNLPVQLKSKIGHLIHSAMKMMG